MNGVSLKRDALYTKKPRSASITDEAVTTALNKNERPVAGSKTPMFAYFIQYRTKFGERWTSDYSINCAGIFQMLVRQTRTYEEIARFMGCPVRFVELVDEFAHEKKTKYKDSENNLKGHYYPNGAEISVYEDERCNYLAIQKAAAEVLKHTNYDTDMVPTMEERSGKLLEAMIRT